MLRLWCAIDRRRLCRMSLAGCKALGESLMLGANKSLVTLRLDNNRDIGDEGIVNLAMGLRTNKTLKVCEAAALCWW